jgi:hypothetical protein
VTPCRQAVTYVSEEFPASVRIVKYVFYPEDIDNTLFTLKIGYIVNSSILITLKMEAVCSSESLVTIYKKMCHIPEDHNLSTNLLFKDSGFDIDRGR